jgi:CrcB protein
VQSLSPVLLAGAGGFLGSAARYLVGGWVHRLAPFAGFPLVLGGFTTFSSFAYETLALTRDAQLGRALVNVTAQVVLGLGAAWLGHALVRA